MWSRTILVADRDDECRERITWCLRVGGFRVLDTSDGVDALIELRRGRIDLLILGVAEPAQSEILHVVLTEPRFSNLPVLLVTPAGTSVPLGTATLDSPFVEEDLIELVRLMVSSPELPSEVVVAAADVA
jgi:CheY-like chemotaxis protein